MQVKRIPSCERSVSGRVLRRHEVVNPLPEFEAEGRPVVELVLSVPVSVMELTAALWSWCDEPESLELLDAEGVRREVAAMLAWRGMDGVHAAIERAWRGVDGEAGYTHWLRCAALVREAFLSPVPDSPISAPPVMSSALTVPA